MFLSNFSIKQPVTTVAIVIVLMVALAAEVTLGVAFRSFGQALAWYDEVASVLLAWLTFYGAALASVRRAHIGCPELVDAMSGEAPAPVLWTFADLAWYKWLNKVSMNSTVGPIIVGTTLWAR